MSAPSPSVATSSSSSATTIMMTHKERLNFFGNKVVMVTGASEGLGLHCVQHLFEMGCHIILACRSQSKTLRVMENIRSKSSNKYAMMEFLPIDLSDLNSVRNCAKLFLEKGIPLHALVCNAGVWLNDYCETKQGLEMTYGVNHLGHFLLVNLLLGKLKESAPSRVVIVSSMAHKYGNITQLLNWAKSKDEAKQQFSTQQTYSNSKLANVLFAYGLARRLNENAQKPQSDVSVVAVHPGVVNTKLFDNLWGGFVSVLGSLFFESPEHASLALVYHAVHPQIAGLTGR